MVGTSSVYIVNPMMFELPTAKEILAEIDDIPLSQLYEMIRQTIVDYHLTGMNLTYHISQKAVSCVMKIQKKGKIEFYTHLIGKSILHFSGTLTIKNKFFAHQHTVIDSQSHHTI